MINRWVEGMLTLFSPQIAWLHQEHDKTMRRWIKKRLLRHAHNDRKLDELSSILIDLARHIAWLQGREPTGNA